MSKPIGRMVCQFSCGAASAVATKLKEPPAFLRGDAQFAQDRLLRLRIRRWWVGEPRWAVWLMLNPSNADGSKDDPTARRVTRFTYSWGYTGWIGVNLYPFISSTPDEMWEWADWESNGPDYGARDGLMFTQQAIEEAARLASLRIVAFGAEPTKRDDVWLQQCLESFEQPSDIGADERLYCLGVNSNGQPLHPLARGKMRVPDNQEPQLWTYPGADR